MLHRHISNLITSKFNFEPTLGQSALIEGLSHFTTETEGDKLILVKGYAGTGKTSLIGAYINALKELKIKTVLLAPTGRAAKVLANYSGHSAFTIHKRIYRQKSGNDDFGNFNLDANLSSRTIFIVDEASMIANQSFESSVFGSGRLLDDLMQYVYNERACKLILVGDTAQLPPVGLDVSPALDVEQLKGYGLDVWDYELTEVVRQQQESGILANATMLRQKLQDENSLMPQFRLSGFDDIEKIQGSELIEGIGDAVARHGYEETMVVCRSNKRANLYNQGIRNTILYREEELSAGDMLMVVKNNYFWGKEYKELDFVANGDIAELRRVRRYQERYGLHFADVEMQLLDNDDVVIEAKVLLDTLKMNTPALSGEQYRKFYYAVEADYQHIKSKKARFKEIRKDPFYNALQIKFAYAVTCHKAQGGQWKTIFVDQGYFVDDMLDKEYLRWLYTALTRATDKLYLVNFKDEFFVAD